MKKYFFIVGCLFFSTRAAEIDSLAQGLLDVAHAKDTIQNLYNKILNAYKNEKFDVAKELLQNAPQDLFGVMKINNQKSTLLRDMINMYAPYLGHFPGSDDKIHLLKDRELRQHDIIELVIKISKPDQLLVHFGWGNTVLRESIKQSLAIPLIKLMLERSPDLVDPSQFDDENDVIEHTIGVYTGGVFGGEDVKGALPSFETIRRYYKNIIAMIAVAAKLNFQEKDTIFSRWFWELVKGLDNVKNMLKLNNDSEKLGVFQNGLKAIAEALISGSPKMLYQRLPALLNAYLSKDNTEEVRNFIKPIIQSVIAKYSLEFSPEDKITIGTNQDNLFEFGLQGSKTYTLDEILEKTGLDKVLA